MVKVALYCNIDLIYSTSQVSVCKSHAVYVILRSYARTADCAPALVEVVYGVELCFCRRLFCSAMCYEHVLQSLCLYMSRTPSV